MPRKKKYATNAERQAAYRTRRDRRGRNKAALRFRPKPQQIKRPALAWHGGKFGLLSWIIGQMPPHSSYSTYVEPFGGAASVLLGKRPSYHEVYNDLNGGVVNFFDMLRARPDELINAIRLTPYSRREHKRAWEPCADHLERARRFYVRVWQSFGSGTATTAAAAGWKYDKRQVRGKSSPSALQQWNDVSTLWKVAERLKGVQIEEDDALKVIQRYDSEQALLYVDPPYLLETRSKSWAGKAYSHEMTDSEHEQLTEALNAAAAYVVLSGYDSEKYNQLLKGWHKVTRNTRDIVGNTRQECLWLSPRTAQAQLPLFAHGN